MKCISDLNPHRKINVLLVHLVWSDIEVKAATLDGSCFFQVICF